jgi:hypothetical protein
MGNRDIHRAKVKSVLHINYSFPSIPVLVRELRRLGRRADSVSFTRDYFNIEDDYCIEVPTLILSPFSSQWLIIRLVRRSINFVWRFLKFTVCFSWRYDVLHFHYHSALPNALGYIDLPLWRMLGRMVIMQYEGSDLRGHPHILPRLFSSAIIVSTPDLLEWEQNAIYIPSAINLGGLPYVGAESHATPIRIVHAPTDRAIKGTSYVVHAVQELRSQGYAIELDMVENVPYQEAIERYKKADIVIDQVLIGWYGLVAIEAMALGKPVMVYIREDLRHYIAGSPLFLTSVPTLASDLKVLMQDAGLRQKLGQEGRDYVKSVHDAGQIANRLTKIYG